MSSIGWKNFNGWRLGNPSWEGWRGLQLPTMEALDQWLDASDLSSIMHHNKGVAQWNAQQGYGIDVKQSVAGIRPKTLGKTQNGLNLMEFDGVGYFRNNNLASGVLDFPGDFTLIMAAQLSPLADQNTWAGFCGKCVVGGGSNRWMFQRQDSSDDLAIHGSAGSVTFPDTFQPVPPFTTFGVRVSGTTHEVWGNGQLIQSVESGMSRAAGTGDFVLGAERLNITSKMDLGEKVIYGRALSDEEMECTMKGYLMPKWGVR